ncbi:hypothetical protein HDU86_008098 [Geranomyces michiganensis]|nr:hypothetical protein HDU86_008098 [Geranomyces michiganensis]
MEGENEEDDELDMEVEAEGANEDEVEAAEARSLPSKTPQKRKAPEVESSSGSESSLGSEGPVASTRMTARQRALAAKETGEELAEELVPELADARPSKKLIFTEEEQALRRSETARRRKHQAHARAEEAKHATIQKLITKQDASPQRAPAHATRIRYKQTLIGPNTLSFPYGVLPRFPPPNPPKYPVLKTCGRCGAAKKYRAMHAGVDVCSIDCWRAVEGG